MYIQRIIKNGIVALLLLSAIIYFMGQGTFLLAIIPILAILFFRFFPDQSFLFFLIYAISALGLRLPFFPHNMPSEIPILGIYVAISLMTFSMFQVKSIHQRLTLSQIISLYIFGFNLLVVVLFRGLNLSRSNISGGWYFVILISFLAFIVSHHIVLNHKRLRTLIFIILGGTMIKAFTQVFIAFAGEQYKFISGFIDVSTTSRIGDIEYGRRVYIKRFSTLNGVAYTIIFFTAQYMAVNKVMLSYLALGSAFLVAALSSYRNGILIIIVYLLTYIVLFMKNRAKIIFTSLFFLLIGISVLYMLAPVLPFQVQRSISFLPHINIPYAAKISATGTFAWRLELWKYTMSHFHEYMLLGRGLVRDYESLYNYITYDAFMITAYRFHSYHSSILSLFMDMGVIGGTSFLVFVIVSLRKFYQNIKKIEDKSFFVIFLQYYFCLYIAKFIVIILAGADAANTVYDTFVSFALIQVMINSLSGEVTNNGK